MSERTLAIIKPDAVNKNAIGDIIGRYEKAGLKPIAIRMMHLSKPVAEGFYAVHRQRPFFDSLTTFMASAPVVVLALEGKDAIKRNPDNDQYYLSLSLTELRANNLSAAESTLSKGLERVPSSGKILWGLGVISALHGNSEQASERLERAVDLLPEWPGGYSTLGVLYYQTGQYDKAREVLSRFKGTHSTGGFDTSRIEQALANAPQTSAASAQPLPAAARQQFLQIALSLADRTL